MPVKFNRILTRLNRISAWILLIFMIIYIISGYAWTNRIIMPLYTARYLHTALDIYMIPLFLAHVLIGTKFTLKRHGIRHDEIVNLTLLTVGVIAYILVLMIR